LPLQDLNFKRDFDRESLLESFKILKDGSLALNDEELTSR